MVATRCLIGFHWTNVCIQLGSDVVGTNTFDAKVSGKMIRNLIPCTAPGGRTFIPTNTEIQRATARTRSRPGSRRTRGHALVSIRKPMR